MRLILWLWQWELARMLSALGLSLSAVSFFVVAVSAVMLPADLDELQAPLYLSITHCHVPPGSERAVSLVWYMPRDSSQGWRHQLAVHDLTSGRPEVQLPWPQLAGYSAAVSRDGTVLYVGGWDGGLWRLSGTQPATPERLGAHPEQGPHGVAASGDNRWLVSLGPCVLQVLDLTSQRPAWSREGDVRAFAMHPREQRIAASLVDGRLVELDCATGAVLRIVARSADPSPAVTFSPDGRLLAMTGGEGSLTLLDWASGNSSWPGQWQDLPHRCRTATLAFSPDGQRLVTGGRDATTLAVWNLRTMELETELRGHEKSINGAVFLDDRRLCSFGADGTIRIWDLASRGPPEVVTIDVTPQAG